ncbi:MAG: NAD-dependent epimerase/dehydratase family protein [Saccharofermentans sp.]|nr:NAD-dependent epimerase/dehydratase family protein [Saccharofermentans sp.]
MSVKYLVSGGEGALGKIIVSMLLERGEKVRILASELSDISIYKGNPNIEIKYGISTDKDSMKEFFDIEEPRSAILFHTDEYISLTDKTNLTMRRVNVIGAENIADMCLKRKIGKLVYLSSAYAINPEAVPDGLKMNFNRNLVDGEYAKSKADAAAYIMERVTLNRLNAVMVLPTFIIGPGYSEDYEINKIINSYLKNGTLPPKEGGHAFVDVRDVANAMLALADKSIEPGSGYIISGEYKTSSEFFADINETQGIDAPVKTASKFVMSESMAKFVNFYYKITHKENPREVYTLFRDNPETKFSSNSEGVIPESTIDFKSSLSDTISGVSGSSQVAKSSGSEPKMSAVAMSSKFKNSSSAAPEAKAAPARPAVTGSRPAAAAAAKAAAQKAPEAKAEEAPAPAKSIIPGKESAPAPKVDAPEEPAPAKSIIPDIPKKPEEPPKEPDGGNEG